MSHSKYDNKTAIKLANKYADSCNMLIQENNVLKTENKDLRANILVNKEIIDCFFSQLSQKDKLRVIESKFKEENQKLFQSNELLNKELLLANHKMAYMEQTLSEALTREKEENECLASKLFVLEQSLIKKNNIIANHKKKREDKESGNEYDREVYIFDPTKAIVQINDELLMYKEIYDSLITHIKDTRDSLLKAEMMISDQQKENSKLRLQFKYHLLTANKEKETLISAIQHERSSTNNRQLTENGPKANISHSNHTICKTQAIPEQLQLMKQFRLSHIDQTKFESEEFMEILKSNNLNQAEFEKLSKNKTCLRLTEAIEMLYALVKDKNMSLNLLKEEIDKLTAKNYQLNKDNMVLFQQNLELRKQSAQDKSSTAKNKSNYADSLLNNVSQGTSANALTNKAISTYHKLIKREEKKEIEPLSDSFHREQSSDHDSIVYMKNIREYSNDINENTTNASKKASDNILKEDNTTMNNNKPMMMTMESITSSELREGFREINSFISTIRDNRGNDSKVFHGEEEKKTELNEVKIKSTNL